MERKYPHLCQPITLGNVTFRNRMFASPIGATDIDKDCVPGERMSSAQKAVQQLCP